MDGLENTMQRSSKLPANRISCKH